MKDKFIAYEAAVSDKSNIFTAQYLHFVFFFTMHMYSCFTDQKIKKNRSMSISNARSQISV
jgi:hypothetical protein